MSCKPVIKWAGGKQKLLPHLLPLPPHRCYVEVFGGGAALLLSKEPSEVEVLNDTHADLVNLYRCARRHGDELQRHLRGRINSRRDFRAARAQAETDGQTDIERAANWLFLNALSFGGDGASFGVQRTNGGGAATSLRAVSDRLDALSRRLDGVVIEDLDWRRCLELYDSPDTLFFLDPPYVGGAQKAYASWTQAQVGELAELLRRVRGRWLVTINDSPENRSAFAFARVAAFSRALGIRANAGEKQKRYGELVVRSWPTPRDTEAAA